MTCVEACRGLRLPADWIRRAKGVLKAVARGELPEGVAQEAAKLASPCP